MNKVFRLALGSSLLVAVTNTACNDPAVIVTLEPHPTVIEVVPEQFMSAERCVDAPGGVRTYVATLTDELGTGGAGSEDDDFALPSSDVVPCTHSIAFGWVVPGHSYRTDIQAFDRDDLALLAPGVPLVVDTTGAPVKPRWTTSCDATRAESSLTQRAIYCQDLPLADSTDTTDATVVEVGIEPALGEAHCGQGVGEVDSFLVRRAGTELGRAACGEVVKLQALSPGDFVELEVQAFTAGSDTAILGGICSATVVSGVTLTALCSPFQIEGAITLDVSALVRAAGVRCNANLTSLTVALDGGASSLSFTASSCGGHSQFSSLAPGAHAIEGMLSVQGADPVTLHCTATVEPGLAATPVCAPI